MTKKATQTSTSSVATTPLKDCTTLAMWARDAHITDVEFAILRHTSKVTDRFTPAEWRQKLEHLKRSEV